jgi:predicted dehydrogenase
MVKIGIVGTGGWSNEHATRLTEIKGVALSACCDVSKERAAAFAERWNVPNVYGRYEDLLDSGKVDGISIVASDAVHAEVSIAALARKIPVLCEKPIATTLADARRMSAAARKARTVNMVNFTKRNSSALQEAARRIGRGDLGRIMHVDAHYLQSWISRGAARKGWRPGGGALWRMSKRYSLGDLGDLGCHVYDMAAFLCGDFERIYCRLQTFDKGVTRVGKYVLNANDSFVSNVVFRCGAIGTIHSTRWGTGVPNREYIAVHGDKGALVVDYSVSPAQLRFYLQKKNEWETIECRPTPTTHARFVRSIRTGKNDPSDFENGMKIQAYLHYSVLSDEKGKSLKIRF